MPHYTKKLKKVIGGLKKASKTHARQARTLSKIEKDQRTRYKKPHSKTRRKR
jgi:Sec-independent protein translocase protein TatA|tara:strand:- start:376 stop:531 length:156 start_codon:yes stop_codon:yes gene_type:complete